MRDRASKVGRAIADAGLLAVLVAMLVAAPAGARQHDRHHQGHHRHRAHRPYLPPRHRVFHGVSATVGGPPDFKQFQHRVRAHPAVIDNYLLWNTPLTTGALQQWHQTSTRGLLSLSTRSIDREILRPGQIARGHGDRYIVRLNQSIAASNQVVYIRLLGEMNGYWSPYCAFNGDGSSRGRGHSTKSFRKAWRRFTIIIRGGRVAKINRRLRRMGMPRLLLARHNNAKIYRKAGVGRRLARPKVAMVWNPQTISNPLIPANSPSRYWPGRRYVDWVGADIFAKFASPGVRAALTTFYRAYRGVPFTIPEYSPWDADPGGAFTRWLFRWSNVHSRTRMLVYYRSVYADSVYDINHYGDARHALRHILNQPRWMSYPPGTRVYHRRHHHHPH
jgi:hypothetical protein